MALWLMALASANGMTCMGADGNHIVRPAKACCASLHERRSNAPQHSQSTIDVAAANLRPLV
ncbi:hypothetical protein OEZ81_26145, partial [Leclercia adecarboxylata]|uniref:hypothetical protein n=1 Tax=Leclercia adecarboxylata TaxID=83655 RepID=UPI00234C6392